MANIKISDLPLIANITPSSGEFPIVYNNVTYKMNWSQLNNQITASGANPLNVTGTGTTGNITKWTTGGSVLGDSLIADNGSTITMSGNITIPNSGTIGSVSTNDAITILSGGQVGIKGTPNYDFHVFGSIMSIQGPTASVRLYGTGINMIFDLKSDSGLFIIRDVNNGRNVYSADPGVNGYQRWYINGTQKMTLDSGGNLGIGTTPSDWKSTWKALNIGQSVGLFSHDDNTTGLSSNLIFDGSNWKNKNIGATAFYQQSEGSHTFYSNGSSTDAAGTTFSPTTRLTISSGGDATFSGTSDLKIDLSGTQIPVIKPNQAISDISLESTGNGGHVYLKAEGGANSAIIFKNPTGESMRITSTGDVLAANASTGGNLYVGRNGGNGSTAASQQELFLRAYSLYQTSDATYYGSYGFIQFNADNGWTSGARKFAITNGYLGTNFAILRSTSAREDIVLDGNGGATSTSIVDFTISNNGLATFFTPLKVSNATAQIILNDANSDSSGSSNEFVMTDYNNNEIFRISKIANTLDTEIANVLNGNLLFRTNNTVRLTISSTGVATFSSTIVTSGNVEAPRFTAHTYPFNSILGSGADASTTTVESGSTTGYRSAIKVNGGGSGSPNTIQFITTSVERMSINNVGQVYINNGCRVAGLYITLLQGNAQLTNASTSSGSNPSYIGQGLISVSVSDIKAKENIGNVEDNECLNQIKSLANHVKKFDWKDKDWKKEKGRSIGMIAQEIYEEFPQHVHKPKNYEDEGWAIRYQEIVPILTKAIQEQQTIIDTLTARIDTLENN